MAMTQLKCNKCGDYFKEKEVTIIGKDNYCHYCTGTKNRHKKGQMDLFDLSSTK